MTSSFYSVPRASTQQLAQSQQLGPVTPSTFFPSEPPDRQGESTLPRTRSVRGWLGLQGVWEGPELRRRTCLQSIPAPRLLRDTGRQTSSGCSMDLTSLLSCFSLHCDLDLETHLCPRGPYVCLVTETCTGKSHLNSTTIQRSRV
jgi:hypothetical protein